MSASTLVKTTAAALCASILLCAVARADGVVKVSLVGERAEKMAIKLDQSSVKAGLVTFDVGNDAIKTGHEMILIKLAAKGQEPKVDAATNRVDEKSVKALGEVSDLKPGARGSLKATLAAGDYYLFCNLKGHTANGMAASFTVTP